MTEKAQAHSLMPALITLLLTVMVSGMLAAIYVVEIPETNRDFALMMFGNVFTLWGGSVVYWTGTSRSSAEKDRKNKRDGGMV